MTTATNDKPYTATRLPDDAHDLAAFGTPDEQSLFNSVYAAIWHEGGKDCGTLETLHRAGIAMLAVLHAEYTGRDSLGPRPEGTKAIALATVQMYRVLNAVKDRDDKIGSIVRPVIADLGRWDYGNVVPAEYAAHARAIASVPAWPGEETGE
jgi:hypothetical protein